MAESPRKRIKSSVETAVLTACRRRCCICYSLDGSSEIVAGQIAHLDKDRSNNDLGNLAFLCLMHHDRYDTKTSQSKGLTIHEVKNYRSELEAAVSKGLLSPLHSSTSNQTLRVVANPTRDGRTQFVDFVVENISPRPVSIVSWYYMDGPDGIEKVGYSEHWHPSFPQRLAERETSRFRAKLLLKDLITLSEIGVKDSDNTFWPVSSDNLNSFKRTAIDHAFPVHLLDEVPVLSKTTDGQKLEIIVSTAALTTLPYLGLSIVIENQGDEPVLCDCVTIDWDYEKDLHTQEATGVSFHDVSHSIQCPHPDYQIPLNSGEKRTYLLDDDWLAALVGAVSPRVKKGSVRVSVRTSERGGWTTEPGDIDGAILDVVKSIVKYQANKGT